MARRLPVKNVVAHKLANNLFSIGIPATIHCYRTEKAKLHDEVDVRNLESQLGERVTISMPKGTLLVLFEFLGQSHEHWRKSGGQPSDDSFVLLRPDAGERVAVWHLECEIERTLPEVFAPNYKDLIDEWKKKLTSE